MGIPETPAQNSIISNLCAMMDVQRNDTLQWSSADMGAMLLHLLDAPLRAQIPEVFVVDASDRCDKGWRCGSAVTMRAVLQAESVPAEVLVAIKEYAKHAIDGGSDDIPTEVAKAVYVTVVARSRCLRKPRVSSLSDTNFESIARWCLAQNWVPSAFRAVVRDGLEALPKVASAE